MTKASKKPSSVPERDVDSDVQSDRILARIGQVTKTLRESLRELGLDKQVESIAVEAVPDARDRLNYIANMTEKAAERVLEAVDIAKPIQDQLQKEGAALDERWAKWQDAPIEREDVRALMTDTRAFLQSIPGAASSTSAQLMEIMMAQDFQDLTGQVIKKIMGVVQNIEDQLLAVLIENIAPERREQFAANAAALADEASASGSARGLLNGPQVTEGAPDVMQDQSQVDSLLSELGF